MRLGEVETKYRRCSINPESLFPPDEKEQKIALFTGLEEDDDASEDDAPPKVLMKDLDEEDDDG